MNDTLTILQSVDAFYSDAFSSLLTVTGVIMGIAAVVLPLIYVFFQRQIYKVDQRKMQSELGDELSQLVEREVDRIREEYSRREKALESKLEDVKEELRRETSRVNGGVLYVQAMAAGKRGEHKKVFRGMTKAACLMVEGRDERNLKNAINTIYKGALPNLSREDIEGDKVGKRKFEELVDKLNQIDENGRYAEEVESLERAFDAALRRSRTTSDVD